MKNGIALAVALILGVLGFAAMYVVMSRPQAAANAGEPTALVRIIVAKKEIRVGTKLDASHLDVKEYPIEYVSAVHVEESQKATILGRALRVTVKEGDPVLAISVESTLMTGAVEIEHQLAYPDTHAVAIELDPAGSVAGLLKPGQKVDLMAVADIKLQFMLGAGPGDEKTITRGAFICQNRTVLAVDVRTNARYEGDPKQTEKHVITLAVTADEAVRVAMVAKKASGHLALRSRKDGTVYGTASIGPIDLFGDLKR